MHVDLTDHPGSSTRYRETVQAKQREDSDLASSHVVEKTFTWGAGIECSFIPQMGVDQFEWTQHNRFWKEDFQLARDLGLTALRYAFPWHVVEPQRGVFDWSMPDERIEFCKQLGIELYLDVMHFGTPAWLHQAAGDPEFPDALERYTEALVGRYRGFVNTWCPCNEPLVLALFSGDFGFWPPHSRGWRGYMPVLSRIMQGVSRSIRAIRRTQPEATVLLCDHTDFYQASDARLAGDVDRRNLRRFLALDLLTGRVDGAHPLFDWVTSYGLSELDLEWFRRNPQFPNVLGLDYYANSECDLEQVGDAVRQRRAASPAGIYGVASAYYQRYGLPMMVTETSVDGKPINREIWLEQTVDDCRRLRSEGIPLLGYFWWPLIDQVDWDGALTHRVGKIHDVGIFNLSRQRDATLVRQRTPLAAQYAAVIASGDDRVGLLERVAYPADVAPQAPPIGTARTGSSPAVAIKVIAPASSQTIENTATRETGRHGIVVFSHLRWGFVWQRPQQFLSRFARKHRILFIEEPVFDLTKAEDSRLDYHQVMPQVTVVTPHLSKEWHGRQDLPSKLRTFARMALESVNRDGAFDRPLLWYYSPMDSSWSLGHFPNRGIIYDCMDELSQFTGAPPSLLRNEKRLMEHADVVFTGGYELGEKKRAQHGNVHTFGCGVEIEHFGKARDAQTAIPPDIDFVPRPILGWFGVIDERVDYNLVGEVARLRPDWSIAMIGPVVKVDPNTLPHAPNLHWLGTRNYEILPSYCKAFDVCLMPFAMNAATQFINPTKALEYMATGRPIIGTPVRDVVSQWSDIVWIARTPDEFVSAVEDALRGGAGHPRVQRGLQLAAQCSWESTVEKMQGLIRAATSETNRPSASPVTLQADGDSEPGYWPTQGS